MTTTPIAANYPLEVDCTLFGRPMQWKKGSRAPFSRNGYCYNLLDFRSGHLLFTAFVIEPEAQRFKVELETFYDDLDLRASHDTPQQALQSALTAVEQLPAAVAPLNEVLDHPGLVYLGAEDVTIDWWGPDLKTRFRTRVTWSAFGAVHPELPEFLKDFGEATILMGLPDLVATVQLWAGDTLSMLAEDGAVHTMGKVNLIRYVPDKDMFRISGEALIVKKDKVGRRYVSESKSGIVYLLQGQMLQQFPQWLERIEVGHAMGLQRQELAQYVTDRSPPAPQLTLPAMGGL